MAGDNAKSEGALDLYASAAKDVPSAIGDFAKDCWEHKGATALHVLETGVTSAGLGAALGYILPAKGPAAAIIGAGFTLSMAWEAGKALIHANDEANKEGADRDKVAHNLAKSFVSGSVDFGINMVGGYYGTELGARLAHGNDAMGLAGQAAQRGTLNLENKAMLKIRDTFGSKPNDLTMTTSGNGGGGGAGELGIPKHPTDTLLGVKQGQGLPGGTVNRDLDAQLIQTVKTPVPIEPEFQKGWINRPLAKYGRRLDQLTTNNATLEQAFGAGGDTMQAYRGVLHTHTVYDDGMGFPKEIFAKGKEEGLEVVAITPHNHDGARQGVGADDPRAAGQSKVPILAKTPTEYAEIVNAAEEATVPGQFVGMYGIEMGTIGPSGHSSGGKGGGHSHGEMNILGEVETPNPLEAQPGSLLAKQIAIMNDVNSGKIQPAALTTEGTATAGTANALHDGHVHTETGLVEGTATDPLALAREGHHGGVNHINSFGIRDTLVIADRAPRKQGIMGLIYRAAGREPLETVDTVHYPDGDYKQLAQVFANHRDVMGEPVIVQLNHPRFRTNAQTDYGIESFASMKEWREQFLPHVKLQEIIKGEALNPDPIDVMKPGDADPYSFIGYMDMGVKAGPTFGRDSHFLNPGGRPAGTGIVAKNLDEPGIFDALRNRRTFATTDYENLQGILMANDRFYMGSVLDQAAVPDANFKVKIGGKIDPEAEYTLNLWGDEKIGDGKFAQSLQEVTVKGSDILSNDNQVGFDTIKHKIGNTSGYFVEINRVDPSTNHVSRMWTAPIWIEPLSNGASHGLFTRFMVGNGSQLFMPSALQPQ